MPDAIVLGLDGANWDLLRPWLDEGRLPNIDTLRESGVHSEMESCLPPVTCPNWRCYSTGKNPGKLGVYWWEKIDTDARTLSTPTSRSFRSANYWDYLNRAGMTAGVVNLPMTYPPFDLDGFMVAGGPGSEQSDYAHPESLADSLDDQGYRLHPDATITSKDDEAAAETIVELIEDRLQTFRDLLSERDVDVAHLTVFYVNVLQHFFWRGDPTRRAWEVIDQHIGAIREEYSDATLYLMSDHGCEEIDTMFYANAWLEREGYLRTTGDSAGLFERVGLNQQVLARWTDQLGVRKLASRLAPGFLMRRLPEDEEGAKREQKLHRVDWDHSRAVASGQGLVYVIGDEEEANEAIREDLEELESEVSGTRIARGVFRREDVYDGPYVDEAPDIVFDQTPGIHTSGAIGNNPVFEDVSHWRAENVRTGLFLADGPDIQGTIDRDVSIVDVAPTLLHGLGCPVPEDVDGDPLRLFDRGDPEYREPIVPEFVEESAGEDVQGRLEDLGYLQ